MRVCQRALNSLLECSLSWGIQEDEQSATSFLSGAIKLDCNVKLVRHGSILPSMTLPSALAIEAYQLLFDLAGLVCLVQVCQLS